MRPKTKEEYRLRRHYRVRRKVAGTAQRPRMSVFASDRHMYVQFIDDETGRTLVAMSTQDAAFRTQQRPTRCTIEVARRLGRAAAEVARSKGIEAVVFDRGGFRYGGRLRALADAAREAGLKF